MQSLREESDEVGVAVGDNGVRSSVLHFDHLPFLTQILPENAGTGAADCIEVGATVGFAVRAAVGFDVRAAVGFEVGGCV